MENVRKIKIDLSDDNKKRRRKEDQFQVTNNKIMNPESRSIVEQRTMQSSTNMDGYCLTLVLFAVKDIAHFLIRDCAPRTATKVHNKLEQFYCSADS